MGIVIRQSFYSSISAYIGVGIGYINAIILMPLFMEPEEIGLMRAVMSIALLLTTFSSFGTGAAIIRFFPIKGSTQKALNQLFTFGLVVVLCAFSLLSALLYLFSDEFFDFFQDKSPEVGEYLLIIAVLILQMTIFNLLEITARSQKKIIVPNAIRDLLYKILHSIVILMFSYDLLSISEYISSIAVIYSILIVVLATYIFNKYPLSLDLNIFRIFAETSSLLKYSLVGILSSVAGLLMVQIDQIMITKYLGLADNGVYTTAAFMAVAVEIPHRFIAQISSTLVSDKIASNDKLGLQKIYKDASINQFILGSLIFILLLINLDNIYAIMPNGIEFKKGWWVFMLLGLVKLVDMTFSLNGEIIAYSQYYKFSLYLLIVLSVLAIGLNMVLIPEYGIFGAAIASLLAYTIFNFAKFLFVKFRFGLSPFNYHTLWVLLILILTLLTNVIIPRSANPYLDGIFRSSLLISCFVICIYKLKVSHLFNDLVDKIIVQISNSTKIFGKHR